MRTQTLRRLAFALVAGVAAVSGGPARTRRHASRVSATRAGQSASSPAGENDWVRATISRPLSTGDRLWSDAGARAEIQVGGAMIRMNAGTSMGILNLDDRTAQLQLTQGTLGVRVRRLQPDQVFEVDTPNLASMLRQPGAYRIEVEPDGVSGPIARTLSSAREPAPHLDRSQVRVAKF